MSPRMQSQTAPARRGKHSKPRTVGRGRLNNDSLDDFFAQYISFDYNASEPAWDEFNRMCEQFFWDEEDYAMREARRNFKTALVQQFNLLYGRDENDLESWHALGRVLNLQDMPQDVTRCRELVRQTHVNLVDLVDTRGTGRPVKVFNSLKKLQDYTIRTEKFFPKEDAKAGGLLRYLLREIL